MLQINSTQQKNIKLTFQLQQFVGNQRYSIINNYNLGVYVLLLDS